MMVSPFPSLAQAGNNPSSLDRLPAASDSLPFTLPFEAIGLG